MFGEKGTPESEYASVFLQARMLSSRGPEPSRIPNPSALLNPILCFGGCVGSEKIISPRPADAASANDHDRFEFTPLAEAASEVLISVEEVRHFRFEVRTLLPLGYALLFGVWIIC